jgi:hypothetical protein
MITSYPPQRIRSSQRQSFHNIERHEEKVCDERDLWRPSEFIQRKLQSALPEKQIPVSVLRMERLVRR